MQHSYGFDWIRVGIVFMLFPFHTARVSDCWEPFYVKDTVNWFSTVLVGALGFWFMSLLFVTAGFSAYFALQKRAAKGYVKERIRKLLIPFLFGLVLVVPIQGYIVTLQYHQPGEPYLDFLKRYFVNYEDLSGYTGGFTPAHLWFILFLFVISLILLPVMTLWMKKNHSKAVVNPAVIFLGFLLMTVADCLPDIGGKNPFLYGLLFLYGFIIAQRRELLILLQNTCKVTLPVGLLLIPIYLLVVNGINWAEASIPIRLSADALKNICAWFIICGLIGFADKYLHQSSRPLQYLGNASYPVYILHQSVLVVTAYFIVQISVAWYFKFAGIMLISLILSLGLYELLRRTRYTRFMLGIKENR